MDDLFGTAQATDSLPADAPLAARMRPRTLEEYAGQSHILGEGKLLRRAIEADRLSSIILYGPPGTGKTSLARLIAARTKSRFIELSGVEGSVADIRKAVGAAAIEARNGGRTLLFIDEIHRFNKAQQDALLPDVERGTVRLIGATTQNPFFSINSPLVSRSQIFQLQPLTVEELIALQYRAVSDGERGLGDLPVDLEGGPHGISPPSATAMRASASMPLRSPPAPRRSMPTGGYASRLPRLPRASRKRPSSMTVRATITTTRRAPSSRVSGAAIPTPPSTGWPRCFTPARSCASSPAGW